MNLRTTSSWAARVKNYVNFMLQNGQSSPATPACGS